MLGPPSHREAEVAARTGRPGVALGLALATVLGGDVLFVEVSRMPGTGALTLTGGLGEVMQESARVALSWVRANAARYGIDPRFHRGADIHVHVQSRAVRKDRASAGVAIVAAMVSALSGRVVRGDLAMTGEITLSGQVLPVAGISEKVFAAHRYGLARVILPLENERQVVAELGDDLRRAVEVHYVAQVEDLLDRGCGRRRRRRWRRLLLPRGPGRRPPDRIALNGSPRRASPDAPVSMKRRYEHVLRRQPTAHA